MNQTLRDFMRDTPNEFRTPDLSKGRKAAVHKVISIDFDLEEQSSTTSSDSNQDPTAENSELDDVKLPEITQMRKSFYKRDGEYVLNGGKKIVAMT